MRLSWPDRCSTDAGSVEAGVEVVSVPGERQGGLVSVSFEADRQLSARARRELDSKMRIANRCLSADAARGNDLMLTVRSALNNQSPRIELVGVYQRHDYVLRRNPLDKRRNVG